MLRPDVLVIEALGLFSRPLEDSSCSVGESVKCCRHPRRLTGVLSPQPLGQPPQCADAETGQTAENRPGNRQTARSFEERRHCRKQAPGTGDEAMHTTT